MLNWTSDKNSRDGQDQRLARILSILFYFLRLIMFLFKFAGVQLYYPTRPIMQQCLERIVKIQALIDEWEKKKKTR